MTAADGTSSPADVAIVCALGCEARPIISALDLSTADGGAVHRSDGIRLLVSGVGGRRSAAAVERLAPLTDPATCWLNFGCAGGHGSVGELVVAHCVRGRGRQRWYPQFAFPVELPTAEVVSVDRPETNYPRTDALYEMEAAGFYATALRRASLERVQVLKVRSDGPGDDLERLDAAAVEALVRRQVPSIVDWIDRLRVLARSVRARRPAEGVVHEFLGRWHFSATQQVQLRRALERLRARSLPRPPASELQAADAREVLAELRGLLLVENRR